MEAVNHPNRSKTCPHCHSRHATRRQCGKCGRPMCDDCIHAAYGMLLCGLCLDEIVQANGRKE